MERLDQIPKCRRLTGRIEREDLYAERFQRVLMRGNVLDLAVAVVIGAAFGAVVTALVKDLLNPLIAAIVGKPDFSAIAFTSERQPISARSIRERS